MPDVELKVNGASYAGWKRVVVSKSLTQLAGGFELSVSDRWPGQESKWPIHNGDSCQLYLNGQLAVTGFVDEVEPSHSERDHDITVKGRDRTADLVDCVHLPPPSQWKNATLLEIAQDICFPFGITVEAEAEGGDPFLSFRANEGDTILSIISNLCKQRQLLPMSYGDGRLVLTRAGTNTAASGLALGVNIMSARGRFSTRDRFSKYVVKGHGVAFDSLLDGVMPSLPKPDASEDEMQAYVSTYSGPKGEATDSVPGRYRPLVILAESKGDQQYFEKRAAWEAQHRAGKSRSISCRVAGWTMADGKLWPINSLVSFKDEYLEIDETLLIESVRHSLDDQTGFISDLTLAPKDAYAVFKEPDKASTLSAGWFIDWATP